jgi:hypothetical protein
MRYELRPRSIGEIMDGAFKIYRDDLLTYLTISALILCPAYLVQACALYAAGASVGRAQAGRAGLITAPLTLPVSLGAHALASLVLTVAMVAALRGGECSVASAFRKSRSRIGAALGSEAVFLLGTCAGLTCLVVPGVIFGMRRLLNLQAVVVESKGPLEALRRSQELCKGDGGRALWPWFFTALLVGAVSLGFTAAIPGSVPWPVKQLLGMVPYTVFAPLTPAILTLSYFDARIRKEALDLAVEAEEALGGPRLAGTGPGQ